MYKVAIIEDNRNVRMNLKELFEMHYPDMVVQVEAFRVHDAIQKLLKTPCEIVILDIQLPDGNAFDLLETLREERAPEFHLILLSKHKYFDYAKKGMGFKARHYLLKPLSLEAFHEAIELVRKELEEEQKSQKPIERIPTVESRIPLRLSDKSIILIEKSTIHYAQNEGNRCLFFAEDGIWETNKHLGYYDDILAKAPYPFFRIHQSYSINLSKLKRFLPIEESVLLENGITLPVARRKIKALKSILMID